MSADWTTPGQAPDEHITNLIAAYARQTLPGAQRARVETHLAICSACREDYALANAVIETTQRQIQTVPIPSLGLLDRVWREIEAPAPRAQSMGSMVSAVERHARRLWSLLCAQLPLIPKGTWVASAAALLIAILIASLWHGDTPPPSLLGLLLAPVAAAGVTFVCDQDTDLGLEIALATPTSPRTTLLCRFVLVYGYNTSLALGGALFLTLARHADLGLLISYWVGPMLLLAGIGLVLATRFGAFAATVAIGALWCLRVLGLALSPLQIGDGIGASLSILWHTSPALIVFSIALLVIAALLLPTEITTAGDR